VLSPLKAMLLQMLNPTTGNELSREIQKEVCWTLSNIAAGSTEQVQQLIDCGIMSSLIDAAKSSAIVHDVKVEACWAVLNATSCGTSQQIEYLVQQG
jgi:importin subunit alpha-6/7